MKREYSNHLVYIVIIILLIMSIPSRIYTQNRNDYLHDEDRLDVLDETGHGMIGTGRMDPRLGRELRSKLEEKRFPPGILHLIWSRSGYNFERSLLNDPDGLVLLRFHSPSKLGYAYMTWNRNPTAKALVMLDGSFWGYSISGETYYREAKNCRVSEEIKVLLPCAPPSPIIESVHVKGDPIQPFRSDGDLWMTTWADDNQLYSGWGDGLGVDRKRKAQSKNDRRSDCGIALLRGKLPNITASEVCYFAPTVLPNVNDKPSSLLFMDGRLFGHFHSPLGDPWIGYIAYSDNYGRSWERVGFWREWEKPGKQASPWTADRNSRFRCQFFINMGRNYELNKDGYVYTLGIGKEWSWMGGVCLTRVRKEQILVYDSYEYFTGMVENEPQWSKSQWDAVPIPGVRTTEQGSVMYHPELKRYLFLTAKDVFDAPNPWGPWTFAGRWDEGSLPEIWQKGYQPGIISKDTGPEHFWFSISGMGDEQNIQYCFNLGKMVLKLIE